MMAKNITRVSIVSPGHSEWHYLWAELAKHESNRGLSDPTVANNFGEVWQYMETHEVSSLWSGKRQFHCFRHRLHPVKGADYRIKIPASRNFDAADSVPLFNGEF